MYVRLARREEREAEARFGDLYRDYAAVTPAFFPTFSHARQGATP
jgi:protein-S-isoprenylcysteine O-methyltransferase Ste14